MRQSESSLDKNSDEYGAMLAHRAVISARIAFGISVLAVIVILLLIATGNG